MTGERSFTYTGLMQRREIIKALRRELQQLNWLIDWKIVRGQSYAREARRHKLLLSYVRAV